MTDLLDQLVTDFETRWRDRPRAECEGRRDEIVVRRAELEGFGRRSRAQDGELGDLLAESMVVDGRLNELDVADRRAQLDVIRSAAGDPGNREATTPNVSIRSATPAEHLARSAGYSATALRSRDWSMDETAWRSESHVSRAEHILGNLPGVPDESKNALSGLFADDENGGNTAARMMVALSDPAYLSAYRSAMRDPYAGASMWGPDERAAAERVRQVCRSMSLGTGSLGYAVPLMLDPTVIFTNAGSANPWRKVARVVQTTSSTWNGVTSVGSTAQWAGEGTAVPDTSPTLGQLQITPVKGAAWIFGSWESVGVNGESGDVADFAAQIPGFLADARDRLEEATFATGAGGTGSPLGFLTAVGTASDATVIGTAARAASDLTTLQQALAPRFRGPNATNAWLSSLTLQNTYRTTPAFTNANFPVAVDRADGLFAFGSPWFEESTFTTATSAASRIVAYGDWSQMVIADRWPGFTIYEPMVSSASTANLFTAQSGWFYAFRTGVGYTTTSAFKVLRTT